MCSIRFGGAEALLHAGAVFFSLVFLALTSLTTVDLLVNERGLVVKEAIGGYYRPVSYYLSKGEHHHSPWLAWMFVRSICLASSSAGNSCSIS